MKAPSNSTMRKARKTANQAAKLVTETRHAAGSMYERTRDQIQSFGESGAGMVRHHPFKTAFTALALGFALGFTVRR